MHFQIRNILSEYSVSFFPVLKLYTWLTEKSLLFIEFRGIWKKKKKSTKAYKICKGTSVSAEKFTKLRSLKSSRVVKVSISNKVHCLIPFVSVRIPVLLLERLSRKDRLELIWNVYKGKAIRAFHTVIDTEHNTKRKCYLSNQAWSLFVCLFVCEMLRGVRFYFHFFFNSFNKNFYKFTQMMHIFYFTFQTACMHVDLEQANCNSSSDTDFLDIQQPVSILSCLPLSVCCFPILFHVTQPRLDYWYLPQISLLLLLISGLATLTLTFTSINAFLPTAVLLSWNTMLCIDYQDI